MRRTAWIIALALWLGGCTGARLGGCAEPESPCDLPVLERSARCCEPCRIGCWDETPCRTTYVDTSLSFLPNVGAGLGGGMVISRTPQVQTSLEILGTWQFLDDEDFVDDGNPAAGDWYQIRAGAKWSFAPKSRRHLTLRAGAMWLQANGEPNILNDPGDWFGIYGGIGFETDVTPCLTVGPELSLFLVTREEEFSVEPVPQLNWHVTWWQSPGAVDLPRPPLGEFYAGAAAVVSPGLGAGLQFGQVFARTPQATWSFEMLAELQDPSDDLWFEGSGNYGQIRGGAKGSFSPCSCAHWTVRGGVVWLRSTAPNEFLDRTGDHVGLYAGLGYEWDITPRFTTGPEVSLSLVAREGDSDIQALPQLRWHFILNL
ncbi:MAG: hypothetical protein QNJ90_14955 [Planctomycetota bacterium]|nr:hypothetical protein [Planctomycetota bacterium]